MSYSLALLREDLRTSLGMDTDDLVDVAADRLLNRSWWEMQSAVRFSEGEGETTLALVEGTDSYSMPTSDIMAIQSVVLQDIGETDYHRLIRIDDWNMFDKEDTNTGQRNIPTHYSRRGLLMIFWPTPDEAYSVLIKYRKTLQDLQTSGPEIPQEWHELILWGAVSRGFDLRGDTNRAQIFRNKQAMSLSILKSQEVKEVEDVRFSGFKLMRRGYP